MIKIKFFASLRERLKQASIELDYSGEDSVEALLNSLSAKNEKWLVLQEQDVLVAVNQTLCAKDARVSDGDEVAFFPPVTGG